MTPRIKICGLKNPDNIREVVKLNPHYIGFVFYNASLRNATGLLTHEFAMNLPAAIKKVGVFVNDSLDRIANYTAMYGLDFIQLHGNESPEFCKEVNTYCKVIKAFGVDAKFDFAKVIPYESFCEYFLFDTKTPGHGGSGNTFDHSLLRNYRSKKEFFLSGGLSELNCKEVFASELRNLHALDFNSRIEIAPGVKDINKISAIKNNMSDELPG